MHPSGHPLEAYDRAKHACPLARIAADITVKITLMLPTTCRDNCSYHYGSFCTSSWSIFWIFGMLSILLVMNGTTMLLQLLATRIFLWELIEEDYHTVLSCNFVSDRRLDCCTVHRGRSLPKVSYASGKWANEVQIQLFQHADATPMRLYCLKSATSLVEMWKIPARCFHSSDLTSSQSLNFKTYRLSKSCHTDHKHFYHAITDKKAFF